MKINKSCQLVLDSIESLCNPHSYSVSYDVNTYFQMSTPADKYNQVDVNITGLDPNYTPYQLMCILAHHLPNVKKWSGAIRMIKMRIAYRDKTVCILYFDQNNICKYKQDVFTISEQELRSTLTGGMAF